jgi:excisionase family DNA binding protein
MNDEVAYFIKKEQSKTNFNNRNKVDDRDTSTTIWYTISEIESKYPILRRTLYKLIGKKIIPTSRVGKKYVIKKDDIEEYFLSKYTGKKK